MKCDGTGAETRFRLSTKRTSLFKSAGASVQSTTGSRAVQISLQGLYCSCKLVFCSHVTLTGYPLHSLVSPSLLLPCVTVCHHISTGLYNGREVVGILTSKPLFTYITGKSTGIYNKFPIPSDYENVKIRANECNLWDNPGFESRLGQDFSVHAQNGSGASQSPT